MKQTGKLLACVLGAARLCAELPAVADGANPYQAIADRNVFGLHPPTKQDTTPEVVKPPPPNITLSGIWTFGGKKEAVLRAMVPSKPGEQPKLQSFIMSEGQREGEIEVIQIDEKNLKVMVNNFGNTMTLDFDKNGVRMAGGGVGAQANPSPYGAPTYGGPAYGNTAQLQTASKAPLSREDSTIIIEAERERLRHQGSDLANLMPATPMTPGQAANQNQGGNNRKDAR
jgi:hypothetical protein